MPHPDQNCGNCYNWVPNSEGNLYGTCRAHAPQPSAETPTGNFPGVWPSTAKTDWCAQHDTYQATELSVSTPDPRRNP